MQMIQSIARAVIYARVSKDEARGRSCREQIKSCEDDCRHEGWPVGEALADNDRSASRHARRERENFKKLPDILRRGDVLVVWEPSRITRNMAEFSPFCDMLAARDVPMYYDGRVYDMNDDDDRNQVWQDILDGAKEVGRKRKRILRAMAANRDDLKAHGKRSAGQRIIRDAATGEAIGRAVEPREAAVLRKAAEMALDGESTRNISRTLAPEWAAAGARGSFSDRAVKRILTNPTTFGMRVHEGVVIGVGDFEPVLDPELMPQLIKALSRPVFHHGVGVAHLLTGIAVCGPCVEAKEPGKIAFIRSKNRKGYETRSYYCAERKHVSRMEKRADAHVQEVLMRWFEVPDVHAALLAQDESGRTAVDHELAIISELRAEVKAYMIQAARTRMSAEATAVYVEETEALIQAAQDRIVRATASVDPLVLDSFGPDARAKWNERSLEEKRLILKSTARVTFHRVPNRGPKADIGITVESLLRT